MAVAADAYVSDLDRVWTETADECGADEKSVAVVFDAAAVIVEMKARLQGITFGDEILSKDICDIDVLRSLIEAIEACRASGNRSR